MELRHLRYVVAVADAGSLTHAARALHVVQQALSQQVADLERELGVRLFERHARGVRPMAAGARFVADARAILARAERAVARARAPVVRPLRVGLVDYGVGTALVRAAVAAYTTSAGFAGGGRRAGRGRAEGGADVGAERHVAGVTLDPRPLAEHPDAVRAGALDVGFWCDAFSPTVGAPADPAPHAPDDPAGGLCYEPLLTDPNAGALLPAAHPLADRAAVRAAELSALPLVAHAAAGWAPALDDELRRLRAAGWRGRVGYEVADGAAVLRLVAGGAGWAQVTASVGADPPRGTVYRPLLDGTGTCYTLYAVTRGAHAPPAELGVGDADPGGADTAGAAARFVVALRSARDAAVADHIQ